MELHDKYFVLWGQGLFVHVYVESYRISLNLIDWTSSMQKVVNADISTKNKCHLSNAVISKLLQPSCVHAYYVECCIRGIST